MSGSSESRPTSHDAAQPGTAGERRLAAGRRRRLLKKFALALAATLISLKVGDVVLGRLRNTSERHWLRLSPNVAVRHVSAEFDYVFRTNSQGFRGGDVSFDKAGRGKRMVVLGDSIVAGVGVPDESVFTVRLQELLANESSPTNVVNLGRTSTSTIVECDLYRRFGRRFQPDEVILVYFLGNDLAEITEERTLDELSSWRPPGLLRGLAYRMLPNTYLELATLKRASRFRRSTEPVEEGVLIEQVRFAAKQSSVDPETAAERFRRVPENVRQAAVDGLFPRQDLVYACVQPSRYRLALDPGDVYFRKAWPRTVDVLKRLKSLVESDGAELRLVVMPSVLQIEPDAVTFHRSLGFDIDSRWLTESARIQRELIRWSAANSLPCLDLMLRFRGSKRRLYHIQDRHLNEAGHALTAAAIHDWLRAKPGKE